MLLTMSSLGNVSDTLPPEHIQPDFSVTRLFAFDSWCTHIWHEFYQFSKSFDEPFLRNRIFCVFLVDFHSARLFFCNIRRFLWFFCHFFWVGVGWGWAWVNSKFLHFVRFCIFLAVFGIFWHFLGFSGDLGILIVLVNYEVTRGIILVVGRVTDGFWGGSRGFWGIWGGLGGSVLPQ